jgi:uncharacterized repeat protein (TIGR01451 family)
VTTVNALLSADLEISKTAVTNTVLMGDLITYTLVISNHGPDTAVGVTVTDTLPTQVSYVSDDAGCTQVAGTVTCALGSMAAGSAVTIQVVVSADQAGVSSNTATVAATSPDDSDDSNNSSTAVVTIQEIKPGPSYLIYLPIILNP